MTHGAILTELEGRWGIKVVKRGLARGEVKFDPSTGLYKWRSSQTSHTTTASDESELKVEGKTDQVDDQKWGKWASGVVVQDAIHDEEKPEKEHDQEDDTPLVASIKAKKSRASSVASGSSDASGQIADDETMSYMHTAYEMCCGEMRTGKALAKKLREVKWSLAFGWLGCLISLCDLICIFHVFGSCFFICLCLVPCSKHNPETLIYRGIIVN